MEMQGPVNVKLVVYSLLLQLSIHNLLGSISNLASNNKTI